VTNNEKTVKTTVIIVDDSFTHRTATAEMLTKSGFEVAEATDNPKYAVEAIRNIEPDVVLFDVVMSQMDGIEFLKQAMKISSPDKTRYIALSSISSEMAVREVMRLGASYYIVKPVDHEVLKERLMQICNVSEKTKDFTIEKLGPVLREDMESDDLERQVTGVILEIGIPAHVKGYHYVRSAIMLAIRQPDAINAVTKVIYPTIAKQYRTSSSRVERAIRHAIEVAWDRGNVETLNSFFGYSISAARGKPTNSEFIAMISDRLRLKNKMKDPKAPVFA